MKVLHVVTGIRRGGAENHLFQLASLQVAHGLDVSIICLKNDRYWQSQLEVLGVKVEFLRISSYGNLMDIFKLRRYILTVKPDILHAHLTPAELYVRLALLGFDSRKFPLIISKHNDSKFYNGPGQSLLGAWVASRAQRIIAISSAVKFNNCVRNLNYNSNHVSLIPYGIDQRPYEEVDTLAVKSLRTSWLADDETYIVGVVARLIPQKSLHILLEGFKLYMTKAKRQAKLVIVGSGPLEETLRNKAIELGIQKQVVWAGFREDIPLVMNAFDVFALTSHYEGLGLVLLEAMAASKPIVASRVSAIPEVVEDGETGILFSPGNSQQLADTLVKLENNEHRIRYGSAGKQRLKSNFTLEHMLRETINIYHDVLEKTKPLGVF